MLERWITALHTEDAGQEAPAATRERLKDRFPKNATRRMTQLGLTLGAAFNPVQVGADDTVVYASSYSETNALEGYLESFPNPSPTLFQTSIHPSAIQQNLILRQQAIARFFPVSGGDNLPAQALLVALLDAAPRVILCGGEERGGWIREQGHASESTFAFALALARAPAGAIGRIRLDFPAGDAPSAPAGALPLPAFFNLLHARRPFDAIISPGRRLTVAWS
jgi:hypothetical protein